MPELMRRFGYVLDGRDRWVHPRFGLECQDPDALLSCEKLDAFHDDATWADELEPQQRPPLAPDVNRAVQRWGLTWDGWVGAFETGNGDVYVTPEDLEALGGDGFDAVMERTTSWYDTHAMRTVGGCAGMGVMLLWLLLGWLAGTVAWLLGMAGIAIATWFVRPRGRPRDLWGERIDPARFEGLLERATKRFDDGWTEALMTVGAIPVDDEHLRLFVLRRTIADQSLTERFTPDELLAILGTLAPVEDEPEE